MSIYYLIIGFILCSGLIIVSGTRLSFYGDIIAEKTGMGKAWFGLIMMAAVTSLPELFTGISAILVVDAPDLAVGDIMGSCAFNLLILAVLDYFVRGKPLSSVVTKSHLLAGFFGILLLTLSVASILYGDQLPVIGWIGLPSLVLIIFYLIAIRLIFKNEQHQQTLINKPALENKPPSHVSVSLRLAVKRYVFFALLVIAGALLLPYFADELATYAGLSQSFVGTLLVAATTSLPELVVSIAAVRLGSMDIAVGNLLGSNIFNMLILGLDDLMYAKGPILQAIQPNHALSGLAAIMMTTVVGISIMYSSPTKRFVLAIDAVILILFYVLLMIVLYNMG